MTQFLAVTRSSPLELSPPLTGPHLDPNKYKPPQGLREAVEVALLLGAPLVLTGRPGAGKTQAAFWLANELNAGNVQRFNVKSTTTGNDLLYVFDEVGRFRDAAAAEAKPLISYVRFNALGLGILNALGPNAPLKTTDGVWLDDRSALDDRAELLRKAFVGQPAKNPTDESASPQPATQIQRGVVRVADLLPHDRVFAGADPRSIVVLIDELDKAPRDTPNDLLAEVERMEFALPELGLVVGRKPEKKVLSGSMHPAQATRPPESGRGARPIVIITSNAEKGLPEPFLRRCAYFDVPFPNGAILAQILASSLSDMKPGRFVDEVVEASGALVDDGARLERAPGTAELLAWGESVRRMGSLTPASSLRAWIAKVPEAQFIATLGVLLKNRADVARGKEILLAWATPRGAERA